MYMIQFHIDPRDVYSLARRHHVPQNASDDGYMVHSYLADLFSERAPSPFRIDETRGRRMRVLAYSGSSPAELTRVGQERGRALPAIAGRQMPGSIPTGTVLGFSLNATPVVRMSSDGEHHKRGAEVDVFLRECWKEGRDAVVDRQQVYRDWLGEQLSRSGAVDSLSLQVDQITRRRLVRKTQGRNRKTSVRDKPVVACSGTLRVSDSGAFSRLLERGVGRHRAFGLGMLLVRSNSG